MASRAGMEGNAMSKIIWALVMTVSSPDGTRTDFVVDQFRNTGDCAGAMMQSRKSRPYRGFTITFACERTQVRGR